MRIDNIFIVILVVLALFSCTSEDHILNDIEKSDPSIEQEGENQVYLSLKVATERSMQKTENERPSTEEEGDLISSYLLFLLDGEKIISIKNETVEEPTTVVEAKILTKVKEGLRLLAVVNTGEELKNALLECTDLAGIRAVRATQSDIQTGYRFMCNEPAPVFFGKEGGTSSTKEDDLNEHVVSVNDIIVSQRTACLSLYAFNVRYIGSDGTKANNNPPVALTSVQFYGMKTSVGLFDEGIADYFNNEEITTEVGACNLLYPNTTSPVTVKIAFTVGTGKLQRTETRQYTINPKEAADKAGISALVHAGYRYRLHVTVNVGQDIDVELTCTTLAWKDNVLDIPVEEKN